jgi:hypothetical protein
MFLRTSEISGKYYHSIWIHLEVGNDADNHDYGNFTYSELIYWLDFWGWRIAVSGWYIDFSRNF